MSTFDFIHHLDQKIKKRKGKKINPHARPKNQNEGVKLGTTVGQSVVVFIKWIIEINSWQETNAILD